MRIRLTILTTFLTLCAIVVMSVSSAVRERNLVRKESIIAKGEAIVTSLAEPCLDALASAEVPDHRRLDRYLDGLREHPGLDVVYAMVIDDDGRIIAHTDPERYGDPVRSVFAKKAMHHRDLIYEWMNTSTNDMSIEFAQPLGIGELRWGTLLVALSSRRVDAQLRSGYLGTGLSALAVIGSLAFMLYLLHSKLLVEPVMALAEGLHRVREGDLDVQVKFPRHCWGRTKELEVLGEGFNAMVLGLREREALRGELAIARELRETHARLEKTHHELEVAHEELQDIHEKLKEAQGQLIQAEKMAALGHLVAGVAHELNNPIHYIAQSLDILKNSLPSFERVARSSDALASSEGGEGNEVLEDVRACLRIMEDGLQRTTAIIRQLRDFSRSGEPRVEVVFLDGLIDRVVDVMEFEFKERIVFHRSYETSPKVRGDPHELTQVFVNILTNAAQAINGPGHIVISLREVSDWVEIDIRDDGIGIKREHLMRVFDPFFTTKEVGEGTGLGLSLTYQIIKRHGGTIEVQSTVGEGSLFSIRLPLAADEIESV